MSSRSDLQNLRRVALGATRSHALRPVGVIGCDNEPRDPHSTDSALAHGGRRAAVAGRSAAR